MESTKNRISVLKSFAVFGAVCAKLMTLAAAIALVALGPLSWAPLLAEPAVMAGAKPASIAERSSKRSTDAATVGAKSMEFVPGQVVVVFRNRVSDDRIIEINESQGTTTLKTIPDLNIYLLTLSGGGSPSEAAHRYRQMPEVVAADPNFVVRAVTNDLEYQQQWYFSNTGNNPGNRWDNFGFIDADIDAPEGWVIGMGSANIRIAILDTGIDGAGPPLGSAPAHPDLAGKVLAHANFSTDTTTDDLVGHGTHVAGLAAAETNNFQFIAGTCPNCSLLNAKVLNANNLGDMMSLIQGINWAVNNGAIILNASLAGAGPCPNSVQIAINAAVGQNAIFVASAGNSNANLNVVTSQEWPAVCNNVVTVAATDARDDRGFFPFSNFGAPIVDIAAPGRDVLSLWPPATIKRLDGTSMAAPIVSGALGVIWAAFPGLTNAQVVDRMLDNADEIDGTVGFPGYPNNVDLWQHGRLNLCRAVGVANCEQPAPRPNTLSAPRCRLNGGQVTLDLSTGTARPVLSAPNPISWIDDPFGTVDSKWRITQVPSVTHQQVPGFPRGHYPAYSTAHLTNNWIPDPSGANWIFPLNSPVVQNVAGFWHLSSQGFYEYRIQFDLPNKYTSLNLTGEHAEDDRARFFLNGTQIASGGGGFASLTPFSTNGPFITPGTNELVVEVENFQSVTGLLVRAQLHATCAPPLPCVLSPGMVSARNTFGRRITLAQTFTPTRDGYLSKITHGLQNISGVLNYDLLVTTTNAGLPSWTGGTYVAPNVLYKATGLTDFSNSGMVNGVVNVLPGREPYLTAGTRYALILIPGSPAAGDMKWRGNSSASSYPDGSAYELNGTVWSVPTIGPKDHGFKVDGLCL